MMRGLTKKQKEILRDWYIKHREQVGLFFEIENCDDFDILEELEEINNFESIIQDINNFLYFLAMEEAVGVEA